MHIDIKHYIDAGEKLENGYYDYYYSYNLFTFSDFEKKCSYRVRSYDDTQFEAHFLGFDYLKQNGRIKNSLIEKIPYNDQLFIEAVRYLIKNEGKTEINVLSRYNKHPYTEISYFKIGLSLKLVIYLTLKKYIRILYWYYDEILSKINRGYERLKMKISNRK